MTITLRSVKGTALNHAELDGNFTDLDGRVTTLQSGTGITKTGTPADNQIAVWTGANSLEGTTALSLTGTLALPLLEVRSTDSNNVVGPSLNLVRASASPAPNDHLGEIRFEGRDAGTNVAVYARIHAEAAVVADGSETGRLFFQLPVTGSGGNEADLLKLGPDTDMLLLSEKDDAGASPSMILDRNSADPAVGDSIGQVVLRGRDSTAASVDYVQLKGVIDDPVTGTGLDGAFQVRPMVAGTSTTVLEVSAVGVEVLTGVLKLPAGATGSRPVQPQPAGSSFYDTTLGIPIWSNGTNWFQADGPALKPFQTATGALPVTALSGQSWKLTGNVTNVPRTDGWNALFLNVSGVSRTITPISPGTCTVIESGTAGVASVTVANNKAVTVIGDGTNLIVFGDVV